MSKVVIAGDASGTGTFTISAPNGNTDRTLVLPDEAGTVLTSASNISQQASNNAVAFAANGTTAQSFSAGVNTLIEYNSEVLDTHGFYDPSNYRFTPTVGGWYWIAASNRISDIADSEIYDIQIQKNGTVILRHAENHYRYTSARASGLVYLNGTGDYVDVTIYININTTRRDNPAENVFQGFLVRAD